MSILDFLSISGRINDKEAEGTLQEWQVIINKIIEFVHIGSGSPESAEVGSVGHIFLRTDNANALYVKQTGTNTNTGWVLK